MTVQLSGLWLPSPRIPINFTQCRTSPNPNPKVYPTTGRSAIASLSSPTPTIQIVGGKTPTWRQDDNVNGAVEDEFDWAAMDADLYYWTRALRPVQWYPGHIAKTEKELKEQLKLMDVVIEVRDARIPLSTTHPQMDLWLGNRKRILVLNREDMVSTVDRNAWARYFSKQGAKVVFSNGQLGMVFK